MEASPASVVISLVCVVVVILSWRVLEWLWLKPKRLEKFLKEQGFKGNPYRIFHGDTKDRDRMLMEARSKSMPQLSHDYLPRVLPFVHHTVNKYGKRSIIWSGPTPMVIDPEPEIMRQVFMRMHEFQKPRANPFILKIATGLVMLEGDAWAHRRKLINPAFHMEKLKLMLPAFSASSHDMIKKWEKATSQSGSCEVDVWSYLHQLSADVISRAAFGSSYEEGRRIFELISEQLLVAIPVINAVYIPGWRFGNERECAVRERRGGAPASGGERRCVAIVWGWRWRPLAVMWLAGMKESVWEREGSGPPAGLALVAWWQWCDGRVQQQRRRGVDAAAHWGRRLWPLAGGGGKGAEAECRGPLGSWLTKTNKRKKFKS